MNRRCTVCRHPQLEAIDRALVAGAELKSLAREHDVSEDAMGRHRIRHLPQLLRRAEIAVAREAQHAEALASAAAGSIGVWGDEREAQHGVDLLQRALDLQKKAESLFTEAQDVLKKAKGETNWRDANGAIQAGNNAMRESRGMLELYAKLSGRLDDRPQVNIQLNTVLPMIVAAAGEALRPWPEALDAFCGAMEQLEVAP